MRTQIIVGIVLLVLGGLFAKYKIFDDKTELKFSISEKIPSDFIENIDESVIQQLTIKNSGDILIASIVVKIDATIQDVKINKFKSTDSVSISKARNHLEILYPELPPLGEVIVLLKSSGNGINYNNIEIFHSKGIAKEAFSSNDSHGSIYFLVLSFVYLIMIFFTLKVTLSDILESKSKYSSLEILRKKKPWYVSPNKWIEIRKVAITYYLNKDHLLAIEKSEAFHLLNSEKKDFLSKDEWHELLDKAENKIRQRITENIYKSFYNENFEELSNLKKPINISYESWKRINEEVSKAFCIHKMRGILRYEYYNSTIDILNVKKPEIVTDDDWLNLTKVLTSFYISRILEKGVGLVSYEKYIDNVNLDFLETSKKTEIEDFFSKIRSAYELEEYYNEMMQILNEMFFWDKIPRKPEFIKSEDWKRIEKLYNRIIKTEQLASESLSEAIKLKEKYLPLKEQVTKQLEIIDNLLSDPKSVEKVEVFNNPFAKGNWENIQQISEIMRKN